MIDEQELATTRISLSCEIAPVKNIVGDIAGLIGNFCEELVASFYSRNVSRKANIVVTELMTNSVDNFTDGESSVSVSVAIDKDQLKLRVANAASWEQYQEVKEHVDAIMNSEDAKLLMARTIRRRRKEQLKGGLGLIRLVAENKFSLDVEYEEPYIIVHSVVPVGGLS